ncbi:MAG TPA: OB-fold nucleic acid binding domain-containing protein [Thermoanaerobaculia bacterium]|nr:OB-fold nucleic acid binding domain-containing protein [Thermoanaerobaculia bacterium]
MRTAAAVVLIVAIAACGAKEESVVTPVATTASAPALPETGPVKGTMTGKVLETMNSAGYTYMRLQVGAKESWVAVRETPVSVGQSVTIEPQMTLADFESSSLKRKFESIIFASIAGTQDSGSPIEHMRGGAAPVPVAQVEKPAGGKSVAELWAQRAQLDGKTVTVRGTVVKFRAAIMGTNWMHIRDGSGSEASGDHDLTVTTDDTAAPGDVVSVTGTLRKNKDFGAGYLYPVIVEKGTIRP